VKDIFEPDAIERQIQYMLIMITPSIPTENRRCDGYDLN